MPQSRKWQLTFNNPEELGFSHDQIVEALENLAAVTYYCLCDEVGSEGTYHTHLYIAFRNPKLHTVLEMPFMVHTVRLPVELPPKIGPMS